MKFEFLIDVYVSVCVCILRIFSYINSTQTKHRCGLILCISEDSIILDGSEVRRKNIDLCNESWLIWRTLNSHVIHYETTRNIDMDVFE